MVFYSHKIRYFKKTLLSIMAVLSLHVAAASDSVENVSSYGLLPKIEVNLPTEELFSETDLKSPNEGKNEKAEPDSVKTEKPSEPFIEQPIDFAYLSEKSQKDNKTTKKDETVGITESAESSEKNEFNVAVDEMAERILQEAKTLSAKNNPVAVNKAPEENKEEISSDEKSEATSEPFPAAETVFPGTGVEKLPEISLYTEAVQPNQVTGNSLQEQRNRKTHQTEAEKIEAQVKTILQNNASSAHADYQEFALTNARKKSPSEEFNRELDSNPNIYILETRSLEDLEKQKEELKSKLTAAGSYVNGYIHAKDKEDYIKNAANAYVSGVLDKTIAEQLQLIKGINAQITLGLNDLHHIKPSGKILLPILSQPKYTAFVQAGLTRSYNARNIIHAGLGLRYFPEAKTYEDAGSYMVGGNIVADFDISRGHRRMSIGGEFVNRFIALSANYYFRLTGWKDSPDFKSDYVQERPAEGFDLKAKYFVPDSYINVGKLAVTASITHWFGKDVSPFGGTDAKDLENSPWIFGAGVEWQPVPALTVEARHEQTARGRHNEYVGLNFNLPLGEGFKDAFNPDAVKKNYNNVANYRYAFIDRDYNMPLQYRATPGKWIITYCGNMGNNRHCFLVKDGLGRTRAGIEATVKPKDPCVALDHHDGRYYTDSNGYFYVTVIESCTTSTSLHVQVDDSGFDVTIKIVNLSITLKAKPDHIQRYEKSELKLASSTGTSTFVGDKISWTIDIGSLSSMTSEMTSDGSTKVTYLPDTTRTESYVANATATYHQTTYRTRIYVDVYKPKITIGSKLESASITAVTFGPVKPGENVYINVEGNGALSLKSDGSQPATSFTVKADENGIATVYVVAEDVDNGTIKINAATDDIYNGTSTFTAEVFTYVASYKVTPEITEVGDDFVISLSGLKPETTVLWTDGDYADVQGNTTTVVDAEGKTSITYTTKRTNFTHPINGITATYYRGVGTTSTLAVAEIPITVYNPALSVTSEVFTGNDTIVFTLSDGKKGYPVAWSLISGYGTLSEQQTVFDDEGKATCKLTGQDPYTGEVVIQADAMDKTVTIGKAYTNYTLGIASFTTTNSTYGDTRTDTMDYRTTQTVNVTDGMPNTQVTVYTDNDDVTLVALNDNRKPGDLNNGVMLAGPGNVSSQSFTLDSEGKGSFEVQAISNFAIKNFTLNASYYRNSAQMTTTSKSVGMYPYELVLSSGSAEICGNDQETITVSGGRAGETVNFSVQSGYGTLLNASAVLDSTGKATTTLVGAAPYTGNVNVAVDGMAQQKTFTKTYKNYTLSINSFNTTNGTYHNVVTDTIDYRTAQTIYVSGGKPNTTVSLSTNDGRVSLNTNQITLDGNGNGSFVVNAVHDFAVDNFWINATYAKNSAETAGTNKYVNMYDYNLNMYTDKNEIYGEDTFTITVTGGRAGEAVAWNLSGDGQYTSASTNFDGNGNAFATVKGISPFATNITSSMSSVNGSRHTTWQAVNVDSGPVDLGTVSVANLHTGNIGINWNSTWTRIEILFKGNKDGTFQVGNLNLGSCSLDGVTDQYCSTSVYPPFNGLNYGNNQVSTSDGACSLAATSNVDCTENPDDFRCVLVRNYGYMCSSSSVIVRYYSHVQKYTKIE